MGKKIKESDYEDCPIRLVTDHIASKWALMVLYVLSNELNLQNKYPMRFGELHKSIASISQKMLTQTLKSLEADGLINRKVYAQVPPKVEYSLTVLGESLIPIIGAMATWADTHQEAIIASRIAYENRSKLVEN